MAATRAPPSAFARLHASSAAASTCGSRSPAGADDGADADRDLQRFAAVQVAELADRSENLRGDRRCLCAAAPRGSATAKRSPASRLTKAFAAGGVLDQRRRRAG